MRTFTLALILVAMAAIGAAPKPEALPPVAPITFADPDGQELILEELSARTAIHGMLSLTELELRFRNPQARRIEGRFTCTLPAERRHLPLRQGSERPADGRGGR